MVRLRLLALAFSAWFGLAQATRAADICLLVDGEDAVNARLAQDIGQLLAGRHTLTRLDYTQTRNLDALDRGKTLARMAACSLVVTLGDRATGFVVEELEDTHAFFVGGTVLSGHNLEAAQLAGVMAYSPLEILLTAKQLLPESRVVGVIYTDGYTRLILETMDQSRREGVELLAKRIYKRQDIAPAIRELAAHSDVYWVLGDPLICEGPAFQYALKEFLEQRKPVIAPALNEVRKGALFCLEPDPAELVKTASEAIERLLSDATGFAPAATRITPVAGRSTILLNRRLAEKLKVTAPADRKVVLID